MRACPVCNSLKRSIIWGQKFLKVEQLVYQCVDCSMVYSSSPDVDYAKESVYACPEVYGDSEIDWNHYCQIAARLTCHPFSAKVLDIGCSTGRLLQALYRHGFRKVFGIDLSEKAIQIAKSKGLAAWVGGIEDVFEYYDVITLSHVLEHVPDPKALLKSAFRVLAKNGTLYIEVPDRSRYSMLPGVTQSFNLEHINHFRMCDLVRLCQNSGLEVVSSGRGDFEHPRGIYPAIWVMVKPYTDSIESYVDQLDDQMGELREAVSDIGPEVAVWGLGQLMMTVFGLPELAHVKVAAATDTNTVFHGKHVLGVKVVPPSEFWPDPSIPILICSQLKSAEIEARIKELGLPNPIITLYEHKQSRKSDGRVQARLVTQRIEERAAGFVS